MIRHFMIRSVCCTNLNQIAGVLTIVSFSVVTIIHKKS